MSKKMEWIKRDGSDIAKFTMTIKGGDLPKDFEAEINVEVSFANSTFEDYRDYIAGGSSGRVTLQAMLRKQSVEVLARMVNSGLKINVKDLSKSEAILTPQDRQAMVTKYLMSLPKEIREGIMKDMENQLKKNENE